MWWGQRRALRGWHHRLWWWPCRSWKPPQPLGVVGLCQQSSLDLLLPSASPAAPIPPAWHNEVTKAGYFGSRIGCVRTTGQGQL